MYRTEFWTLWQNEKLSQAEGSGNKKARLDKKWAVFCFFLGCGRGSIQADDLTRVDQATPECLV